MRQNNFPSPTTAFFFNSMCAAWLKSVHCSMLICAFVLGAVSSTSRWHAPGLTEGTSALKQHCTIHHAQPRSSTAATTTATAESVDQKQPSSLHYGLFSYRSFLDLQGFAHWPCSSRSSNSSSRGRESSRQAGRQAYTCGMWREASAFNNNTVHKKTGSWG